MTSMTIPVIVNQEPSRDLIISVFQEISLRLKDNEVSVDYHENILGIFISNQMDSQGEVENILIETIVIITSAQLIIMEKHQIEIIEEPEFGRIASKQLWRNGVLAEWLTLNGEPIGVSSEDFNDFNLVKATLFKSHLMHENSNIQDSTDFSRYLRELLDTKFSLGEITTTQYHDFLTNIITVFPIENYFPSIRLNNNNNQIFATLKLSSLCKLTLANILRYDCITHKITIEDYQNLMNTLQLPSRSIYKLKPIITCPNCKKNNALGSLFCLECNQLL